MAGQSLDSSTRNSTWFRPDHPSLASKWYPASQLGPELQTPNNKKMHASCGSRVSCWSITRPQPRDFGRYPPEVKRHCYNPSDYMRDVTCPQCETRFASRSIKCFCPNCDCAFMRDGAMSGSQDSPLVHDRPPADFESLSPHDQRWVHFLMTCIGRRPNYMTDYLFIEIGWSNYLGFMTSNLWVAGTGSGLDRAYRLTDNGTASLCRLNARRGPCDAPPAPEIQSGG